MRFPSRGTAAFTRVPRDSVSDREATTTALVSRSYTPSSSFLNAGKDFPISKSANFSANHRERAAPSTFATDPTSIVIRALEIHRLRTEKIHKEKSEKARVEREKEKKRLLDVQREATLGKIKKVQKELGKATTTTLTTTKESRAKKKREEEDTGGENPFARGNKKAKKGGKRAKK